MKTDVLDQFTRFLLLVCLPWTATAISCENKTSIDLSGKEIFELDEFIDCEDLKTLVLRNNSLTSIGANTFNKLNNLVTLDLSYNKLNNVHKSALKKLKTLFVNNNDLSNVDFLLNSNLEKFNGSHNKVTKFPYLLRECKLVVIDMSYNALLDFDINNCKDLINIDFSHNQINVLQQFTTSIPKLINLSFNNITGVEFELFHFWKYDVTLDLRNNLITEIEMEQSYSVVNANDHFNTAKVLLNSNPLNCSSCATFLLAQYFHNQINLNDKYHNMADLIADNLTCAEPENKKNHLVKSIDPKMFLCKYEAACIKNCSCSNRMADKALVIDCSRLNLSVAPSLKLDDMSSYNKFNKIELILSENHIKKGPSRDMGYEILTKLDLSNNELQEITWMPPKLQEFYLHKNNLKIFPYEALNVTFLHNISFSGNPWMCNCDAVNFTKFIYQHSNKVYNQKNIYCDDKQTLLINISESTACTNYKLAILSTLIVLVILILIITIIIAVFYKFNYHIKVWLYSHGLCLNWILVENEDKNKPFDAFLSCSPIDEKFVYNNLYKPLHDAAEEYKLCMHLTDDTIGQMEDRNVQDLIEKSKRTIIFLSDHFLKNTWSVQEFRAAHLDAMEDANKTVIIIIHKSADISNLDNELDTYLKTNTYVEWEDPWFWRKIKYAMPHMKYVKRNVAV